MMPGQPRIGTAAESRMQTLMLPWPELLQAPLATLPQHQKIALFEVSAWLRRSATSSVESRFRSNT